MTPSPCTFLNVYIMCKEHSYSIVYALLQSTHVITVGMRVSNCHRRTLSFDPRSSPSPVQGWFKIYLSVFIFLITRYNTSMQGGKDCGTHLCFEDPRITRLYVPSKCKILFHQSSTSDHTNRIMHIHYVIYANELPIYPSVYNNNLTLNG